MRVLNRLATLTKSLFEISNPSDQTPSLELDNPGPAKLEFQIKNEKITWIFEVDDDWIDPTLFVQFDKLIEAQNPSLRLWSFNDGQSDLFFVRDTAGAERLAELTGQSLIEWRKAQKKRRISE